MFANAVNNGVVLVFAKKRRWRIFEKIHFINVCLKISLHHWHRLQSLVKKLNFRSILSNNYFCSANSEQCSGSRCYRESLNNNNNMICFFLKNNNSRFFLLDVDIARRTSFACIWISRSMQISHYYWQSNRSYRIGMCVSWVVCFVAFHDCSAQTTFKSFVRYIRLLLTFSWKEK